MRIVENQFFIKERILAHTWQCMLKKSILSLDSMTIKDVFLPLI